MGWLQQKIGNWATKQQTKELDQWLAMLRPMNGDELGGLVALATHMRHGLEKHYSANLLDPILTYSMNPNLVMKLHGLIKEFQSRGEKSDAAGVMVWLHTLRCGGGLELRQGGRDLWRELQRGFPHVDASVVGIQALTGKLLNVEGYKCIPIGLEPNRT